MMTSHAVVTRLVSAGNNNMVAANMSELLKDATQIRFENFQGLFEQFRNELWRSFPDEPEKGMLRKFAHRATISERYASHLNCGRKGMGARVARTIEEALGLPHGWMDQDHSAAPSAGGTIAAPALGLPDEVSVDERRFLEAAKEVYRSSPKDAQAAIMSLLLAQVRKKDDGE